MGERYLDLRHHPPGVRGQDQDPVAHQHRFLNVMRDDQDRLDRQLPAAPQLQQVGTQVFRSEHVEGRERLVHQQQGRIDHQPTGKAHPLAHATGQLAWVGVLKTVEANQVDRRQGALACLLRLDLQCLQAGLDVLQHGQPGKQSECLEHHGHAFRRAAQRVAVVEHFAGGRLNQAGDNPQQRRLARTGAPQQTDDFTFMQVQINVTEYLSFVLAFAKALGHLGQRVDFTGGASVFGMAVHGTDSG